jgi:Domain of unknown function (DUF4157)
MHIYTRSEAKLGLHRPSMSARAPHDLVLARANTGDAQGVDTECRTCRTNWLAMQRQATSGSTETVLPPIINDMLGSPGQPLDAATRAFMEPRFGHDFSQVRVHSGDRAAQSAEAVNALAYTVGRDVIFGAGRYAPETSEGRRLIAHELTHVVQQRHASDPIGYQPALAVSQPDDPAEQEADAVASQILRGEPARVQARLGGGDRGKLVHVQRQDTGGEGDDEEEVRDTELSGTEAETADQSTVPQEQDDQGAAADGGMGAELEALAAIAANPDTQTPDPVIDLEADEDVVATAIISRAAAPGAASAAPVHIQARDVTLEFIPDERLMVSGLPMGVIHVRVKGKEVEQFFARGGPPATTTPGRNPNTSTPDPDAPGHSFGPTPAGSFKLASGEPHISHKWTFSQLAWGTPLREVDTPRGKDVQYKTGSRWRSIRRLKGLTRDTIIMVESALGRSPAIPSTWDLNDFGKLAFHIRGTQAFVHTTPPNEDEYRKGGPENLSFSHGCIHIKPSDRDAMIAHGYLQAGVKVIVRRYRDPARWGTKP